jgi:hypothetical protein
MSDTKSMPELTPELNYDEFIAWMHAAIDDPESAHKQIVDLCIDALWTCPACHRYNVIDPDFETVKEGNAYIYRRKPETIIRKDDE